ncbi:DUF2399 domain-containing protein [Streptomyces sp. NBC_00882]|uniref:DUF2399 domain-containing protein n=1 Tax=Streptomyces sp. NBC_00882 TaxID=2975856 RepID=UPI00386A3CCC|nr:DUF2399 domain-containing protein [Streptomyces sp. NBC_00882]WSZ36923.1 DUF2399 domain-containing protein [Streptomyces sp. NBC_00882]
MLSQVSSRCRAHDAAWVMRRRLCRSTDAAKVASVTHCLSHTAPHPGKLAHDHAGDPHYFDPTTGPEQRLITALAELADRLEPTRPDHIRALLAEHAIIADRLYATVLLNQVRVLGDGPIDRRLNEVTTPVALNLLDLTRAPPRLAPDPLTVVENPSVLEAAMECASTQPRACTKGQLRVVDHVLLQLAVDQGVPLRYAGNLDVAGLRIAAAVQQTYGATLIAMDAALVQAAGDLPSAVPLGPLPNTTDPDLADRLKETGRVIYQEHDAVLSRLLDPTCSQRRASPLVPRPDGGERSPGR